MAVTQIRSGNVAAMFRCGFMLLLCSAVSASAAKRNVETGREKESKESTVKTSVRQSGYRIYVGTYTGGASQGIYQLHLDTATGRLTKVGLAAVVTNPSFLAVHPNQRFLYAVNEVASSGGKMGGAVSAFLIDPENDRLKLLNHQSTRGGGPCHLVVDKAGKNVLVANYGGGSVAAFPLGKHGRLSKASAFIQHTGSSVNPARQKAPHAHSIVLDIANRYAVAADLGLDKVLVYKFDPSKGTLRANSPPSVSVTPGSGPRHFAFHPKGRFAYVINEITLTVTAFRYNADQGILTPLQTISTLPKGFKGRGLSTAELQIHPSGKFLYGSNRGHDTIAIFRIDQRSGKLTAVGHQPTGGKTPRNFCIDPSGRFLLAANQSSNTVVVFRINAKTGQLKPTGHSVKVPAPVCVVFLSH